ncbi:sugar ABC transporter permease [Streptomyces spiroverticillatus]|nr:carbohydrate ABC transporter permease [Streptomyces finlayi]GHA02255.1 sugar ABC transporter permease [Streptomyces spiroverticillatus]
MSTPMSLRIDTGRDRPPQEITPDRPERGQRWVYVVLAAGLVVVCAPFVWMVLSSFKTEKEIYADPPTWFPETPGFDNFSILLDKLDIPQFLFNSVFVATVTTLGNLLFCSMLGYALAKIDYPGKKFIFGLVLSKLMIPGIALLVPTFVVVASLGLVDSYAGIILPGLAAPMGVFLMRQFIQGLPDDLIDAGRVDGAGEFRIFFRIILPLCRPALATLGLLTFLASWNSFLWPLVVAQSEDLYTLPVGVALYSLDHQNAEYGLLLAGASMLVLPIIAVFVYFQRHFVQGIATTGLK